MPTELYAFHINVAQFTALTSSLARGDISLHSTFTYDADYIMPASKWNALYKVAEPSDMEIIAFLCRNGKTAAGNGYRTRYQTHDNFFDCLLHSVLLKCK